MKQPDPRRPGHGKNRRSAVKDGDFSGSHVHPHSARAPLFAVFLRQQKRCRLRTVKNSDTQPLQLMKQRRLKCRPPDAQRKAVRIIVGEHQLRFLVPKLGSLKFILRIADFPAEGLHIQQPVISFPAFDIVGDTIAVMILFVHIGLCDFLRRHLRTGVGTGGLPVIDSTSRRSATDGGSLFHQSHRQSFACRRDRSIAAGNPAAQHQNVRCHFLFPADFIFVRPLILTHLYRLLLP